MLKRIPREWTTTADLHALGRAVSIHQSSQAVILEVDGLCLIGDTYPNEKALGGMGLVVPKMIALSPTLEDAKKAVEMDGVTTDIEGE
jgi:hypothetical protein